MNPSEYAQQIYERDKNDQRGRGRAFFAGLYDEAVLASLDPDYDGWQEDTTPPPLVSQEEWDALLKLFSEAIPGWD